MKARARAPPTPFRCTPSSVHFLHAPPPQHTRISVAMARTKQTARCVGRVRPSRTSLLTPSQQVHRRQGAPQAAGHQGRAQERARDRRREEGAAAARGSSCSPVRTLTHPPRSPTATARAPWRCARSASTRRARSCSSARRGAGAGVFWFSTDSPLLHSCRSSASCARLRRTSRPTCASSRPPSWRCRRVVSSRRPSLIFF